MTRTVRPMGDAAKQLLATAAMLARRKSDQRLDAEAARALTRPPEALGLPPGLEITWLGVAGYVLSFEGTTILIDPYVTRCDMATSISRRRVLPDITAINKLIPRADAILVGHTHFDHALDVPATAARDNSTVYGSKSLVALMALEGLQGHAVEVEAHATFEVGPFEITFVPSQHSRFLLGRVPYEGEITCEHLDAMSPNRYRCGQVWGIRIRVAGVTFHHQGSADLVDDELASDPVDVFLCGIAGRHATENYMARILPKLDPEFVVIGHHDDFFQPIGVQDRFALGVALHNFPDEVAAVSRDASVMTLPAPGS